MDKLMKMERLHRIALIYSIMLIFFIWFLFTANGWILGLSVLSIGFLGYTNHLYTKNTLVNANKEFHETVNSQPFEISESDIGGDGLCGIAISHRNHKLFFLQRNDLNEKFSCRTVDFKDVIESEIVEDNRTVDKVSRGSQLGGVVVGSAIGGVAGGIVGGLSAKRHGEREITSYILNIVVDDLDNPNFQYVLHRSPIISVNTHKPEYKEIMSTAFHWHNKISVIIKRNIINQNSV